MDIGELLMRVKTKSILNYTGNVKTLKFPDLSWEFLFTKYNEGWGYNESGELGWDMKNKPYLSEIFIQEKYSKDVGFWKYRYVFNRNGNLMVELHYFDENSISVDTNCSARIDEPTINGKKLFRSSSGQLEYLFNYNKEGALIEYQRKDYDGHGRKAVLNEIKEYILTYDANGNLLTSVQKYVSHFRSGNRETQTRRKYEHILDDRGNWILRRIFNDDNKKIGLLKRDIDYYSELEMKKGV